MNTIMWEKPVVQGHLTTLTARGARIIPPTSGTLACGEEGVGAMADVTQIAEMI
jgi:phosphopantothenoylcysteine decarboxylase/phosphopantothenate--cysteine ligase